MPQALGEGLKHQVWSVEQNIQALGQGLKHQVGSV
jgi:hypothetical protein